METYFTLKTWIEIIIPFIIGTIIVLAYTISQVKHWWKHRK